MKTTRILFVHKENKNKDLIHQFLLFCLSLCHVFMRVPQCMRVVLLTQAEGGRRRCVYIKQSSIVNTSEDSNGEDDLQFFAQPYLFEPEYTDDELRDGCSVRTPGHVSAAPHACIMVLLWTCIEDWRGKEEIVERKSLFLFSLHTKSILVAS